MLYQPLGLLPIKVRHGLGIERVDLGIAGLYMSALSCALLDRLMATCQKRSKVDERTKPLRTMTPSRCSTSRMSAMGAVAGRVVTVGRVMLG
jgi:hypothetical protein